MGLPPHATCAGSGVCLAAPHYVRRKFEGLGRVWAEVVRLLEDPALIQQELDRRLAAARTSDPTRKREQSLQRELSQVDKAIERLLTAYQEELLSLEQLRERMPMLRR
jgi:site-specific DNA recombinase